MIDLTADQQQALRELVRAGPQGIRLGVVPVSAAVMLGLCGLAEITTETPQRVIATSKGAAFLRRVTFA